MPNYYNCIDVSEHNGEIDWSAAYENGVRYAFIRCGFGQDFESQDDKKFHINMERAFAAGVKVGVYFYAYAFDYDTAVGEAKHCIRLIEPYRDKISFPVFYDLEEKANLKRLKDVVMGFVNTLNYYGYNVGCYVTTSWYSEFFRDIDVEYIWLAYLGSTKPEYCDIWQYSWTEDISGVGECDADILYNEDMKLLINGPEPQPEPSPEPKPEPQKAVVELDVLERYDTGSLVNTLKALLKEFEYGGSELVLDGDFDWATEEAVKNFQKLHDLPVTGIVDQETWTLLLL